MKRLVLLSLALLPLSALAKPVAKAAKPATPAPKPAIVERIGMNGWVRVPGESFNSLSTRQKELAYWLSQAAIAVDPIIYDQSSRFGLRQKYVLDLIVSHPKGIDPAVASKITEFAKVFWAHHGNHNSTTAQKFLPTFTPAELETAALKALSNTPGAKMTKQQMSKELAELQPSLFDATFEPQLTAKSPEGGLDIIQGSANNFYARDVKLADLADFKEQYPLNSRVSKTADGKLVEEVYRAGTPDGKVPPGLYAQYLGKSIEYLKRARAVAEPGQAPVLDALIKFYQTGDFKDWLETGRLWVANNETVDFANGFIEVYRDARGAKGTSQAFVSVIDAGMNKMMSSIAANAQYFENHAPWDDAYKKQGVTPPLAKAIETVIETGDFAVGVVGDNLPNENEIREKYGTKSFLFTGSTRALNAARGSSSIAEFAYDDAEAKIVTKYGIEASDMLTALHEIIGHGSGKVSPKLTKAPETYLSEYYSTLEEARADLMALWNVWDPKLKELGLVSDTEGVARAMYYSSFRQPLQQLRSIPKGDTIEEDHLRDRSLIGLYVMDKVPGSMEWQKRDGKTYIHLLDFDKARQGVGMLLKELMRIKAEGDYPAIKALIDQYGVHFDPKLRDEVVARFKTLNLPTYMTGINAKLTATTDAKGKVTKVTLDEGESFQAQRLRYAAMFHPELK